MTGAHLNITFARRVQKPAQYWHNAAQKMAHHARTPTTQRSGCNGESSNISGLDVGSFPTLFYTGTHGAAFR
jgi:hypothetical protein